MRRIGAFLYCCAAIVWATALFAQPDDRYQLMVGSAVGAPGSSVQLAVNFDSIAGTNGHPANLLGWSYGVCSDPTLVTVTSVVEGSTTATINQGTPPAFSSINITPNPGSGFTVGVVVDFATNTLSPGSGYELNVATYDLSTSVASATTSLDFCDTLSNPLVETLVVEQGGVSIVPVQSSGLIEIAPPGPQFIRGDVNGDGGVNLVDAIFLGQALFQVGAPLTCDAAGDIDDNDTLEPLIDLLALLTFLFQGAAPPATPYPACGIDPTLVLTCSSGSGCP